jgi:hypothetical protein
LAQERGLPLGFASLAGHAIWIFPIGDGRAILPMVLEDRAVAANVILGAAPFAFQGCAF